jgi:hypothetical protein
MGKIGLSIHSKLTLMILCGCNIAPLNHFDGSIRMPLPYFLYKIFIAYHLHTKFIIKYLTIPSKLILQ